MSGTAFRYAEYEGTRLRITEPTPRLSAVDDGALRLDADRAILVVVDVQRDFCAREGTLARRGRDVSAVDPAVDRIIDLLAGARAAHVPVVFVTTAHSAATHPDMWRFRCGREDPPDVCADGSPGAALYRVAPEPGEAVVVKRRYSAFGAPGFLEALEATGRRSLLFCGVATNVCVETSLRDAVCADFFVTLVEDCSAAYSPEGHQAAVRNVSEAFGLVTTTDELLGRWSAAAAVAGAGGVVASA